MAVVIVVVVVVVVVNVKAVDGYHHLNITSLDYLLLTPLTQSSILTFTLLSPTSQICHITHCKRARTRARTRARARARACDI